VIAHRPALDADQGFPIPGDESDAFDWASMELNLIYLWCKMDVQRSVHERIVLWKVPLFRLSLLQAALKLDVI
jgi:hypothetical protein